MSYQDTEYKGWTIREHFPGDQGKFQIVYTGGRAGSYFTSRKQAEQSIDFQIANAAPEHGKF
ncbi:MAG: hypothetical protein M3Q94_20660 [Pseudomonadota bacterium]|nr:hypothetical protein [Pseudomonadota bacterium]